jgi:hypothetical protein
LEFQSVINVLGCKKKGLWSGSMRNLEVRNLGVKEVTCITFSFVICKMGLIIKLPHGVVMEKIR